MSDGKNLYDVRLFEINQRQWKSVEGRSANIGLSLNLPRLWRLTNQVYQRFKFLNKGVTQTWNTGFVIAH